MDALDVISLASAKNWISVDTDDTQWDDDIKRLIKSAVAWVEKYTCWQLYQRDVVLYNHQNPYYIPADYFPDYGTGSWNGNSGAKWTPKGLSIYLYPFTLTSVKDKDGNDVDYTTVVQPLKTILYGAPNSLITISAGFASGDTDKIPTIFLDACYKLITDWFENRDNYKAELPGQIQTMLNQYRRAII